MNLYLLTNPYGRYTLDEEQKQSARLVGIALFLSLFFLILSFIFPDNPSLSPSAILCFAMMIPLGSMNNPDIPKHKKQLRYFTGAITACVLLYIILSYINYSSLNGLFVVSLLLLVAYQWYANYVMLKTE
jgi:hypothetical protein